MVVMIAAIITAGTMAFIFRCEIEPVSIDTKLSRPAPAQRSNLYAKVAAPALLPKCDVHITFL
jgi:hypothetical protein